jgi:DNA-directed RNA polymerase specialized sigma24 family protein
VTDSGALFDQELIILIKQDDSNAFTKIYQKYWQELYNAAYKRNRNREQCQDIVQNVFTDLWNRRMALTIDNLQAFLHTAVRFQVFHQ